MTFNFLANQIPGAGKFGELETYPPQIIGTTTNPNLGADGSAIGRFARVGPVFVAGWCLFHFAGAGISAGSGNFEFTLPIPADMSFMVGSAVAGAGFLLAGGFVRDDNASGSNEIVQPQLHDANHFTLRRNASAGRVSASMIPWDADDQIAASFFYVIEAGT